MRAAQLGPYSGVVLTTCQDRPRSGLLDSGEIDGEEPVRAVEAFQLHLATLQEVDTRAGDKVVHHAGHQDLAAEGLAGDARRIVNGLAEEAVGFIQRIAGVNTYSDADRRRLVRECD